jgi:hypothetical protein
MGRVESPTKRDYQIGEKVWLKPCAHLYRDCLMCFASTSRGAGMLRRLERAKALLITPPAAFDGVIKGKNKLPGKGSQPAFEFYHVEVLMRDQRFDFITTAQWMEARE